MKHKNEPMPLLVTKMMERLSLNIWNTVHDSTYVEIEQYCSEHDLSGNQMLIFSLREWLKYKQIFEFDSSLFDVFQATKKPESTIPTEILENLAYPSGYIKIPDNKVFLTADVNSKAVSKNSPLDGFVYYITTLDRKKMLILQMFFKSKESFSVPIPLDDEKTLTENIQTSVSGDSAISLTCLFSMMILYLCAENADIQENSETRNTVSTQTKRPATSFKGVKKWNVGFRVGNVLRKNKTTAETSENAEPAKSIKRSPKKPHVRQGHFHHYWKGKGPDRKLVLKWTHIMLIHGDFENVTTIHKVK